MSPTAVTGLLTWARRFCYFCAHASISVNSQTMGRVASLLLLPLLLMVEVHCQTSPYVSFMGQTLANNSFVDISQVGTGSAAIYCHTDLMSCCSNTEGPHRGDWYSPDGTRLVIAGGGDDIYEAHTAQRVDIRRTNNANEPTGIYRCDIPTVATHTTDNSVRASVYVGLYTSDGGELLCDVMLLSMIMRLSMWDLYTIDGGKYYLMHCCIAGGRGGTTR